MKKSTSKLSLSLLDASRTQKPKPRVSFSDGVFCEVASLFGGDSVKPRCECSGKAKECFHLV